MVYYIEQVEGELVELSYQLAEAVRNGQLDVAHAIYTRVTGKVMRADQSLDWWMFNAPGVIRRQYQLSVEDIQTLRANLPRAKRYDDESLAHAMKYAAERKVGGKWKVFYEY